jgi:hypothetical protein
MEAVFILGNLVETIRNCCVASEAYCLSTDKSDLRALANQFSEQAEAPAQAFTIERGVRGRQT